MSKRLQVVLDEGEYRDFQRLARRRGLTLSQWVRQSLAAMRRQEPVGDPRRKLAAVREAARGEYPTDDIRQMLDEIESGYRGGQG